MSSKISILLVEDEENLHEALKLNLELEGYEITSAFDGTQALKAIQLEYFDLIILDVMLPGVDGIGVTETIRVQNNDVPILILSAKNASADRVLGLKKGADDYLTKPFRSGLSGGGRSSSRAYEMNMFVTAAPFPMVADCQILYQNMSAVDGQVVGSIGRRRMRSPTQPPSSMIRHPRKVSIPASEIGTVIFNTQTICGFWPRHRISERQDNKTSRNSCDIDHKGKAP